MNSVRFRLLILALAPMVVLTIVGLVACLQPALRAARIEPVRTLSQD